MIVKCINCEKEFNKLTYEVKRSPKHFCSENCFSMYQKTRPTLNCHVCSKSFIGRPKDIKNSKSGYNFCSRSCSATFNNKQKRKSRRSKCEQKLINLITSHYPQLSIQSNDKTMLGGLEVDIAIPSLNLAIEWNGIVHFKPIYGEEKLRRIQQIDQQKLFLATAKNINLVVIPDMVSTNQHVSASFQQIKYIIDDLSRSGGN